MMMVGDVYIQRADPQSALAPIRPFLQTADIGFCNLETVVADRSCLDPDDRSYLPRTEEAVLPMLVDAGFNVFNIANNPNMYHGLACFVRQLDLLDGAGIIYGGGGRTIEAARKPAIVERDGTRVAFVCRTSVGLTTSRATTSKPGVARVNMRVSYEAHERALEVPGSPPLVHTQPDPEHVDELIQDIES